MVNAAVENFICRSTKFGAERRGNKMLLDGRFAHSGSEQLSVAQVWDAVADTSDLQAPPPRLSGRHTVHIVADEALQRAATARAIFASGHHAEVYTDVAELVDHSPTGGTVLVHEWGKLGAASVCQALAQQGIWLPVMGFGIEIDASRIVAGMKAGAMDYIVGTLSVTTILAKLDECSRESTAVFEARDRRAKARAVLVRLSDRERQVLDMLATGLSNKEMARELGISPRTVEIHRMKMMVKIGASSSTHAVRIHIDALDGDRSAGLDNRTNS